LLAAAGEANIRAVAAAVLADCYHIAVRHLRREPFSLLLWAQGALLALALAWYLPAAQTVPSPGIPRQLAAATEVTATGSQEQAATAAPVVVALVAVRMLAAVEPAVKATQVGRLRQLYLSAAAAAALQRLALPDREILRAQAAMALHRPSREPL
jgi:hypothetical protein